MLTPIVKSRIKASSRRKKRILLQNKWLTVWKESFRLPNGVFIPEYYFVERPDLVAIVPLLGTHKVFMLRQWRPIPRGHIYNLPMGFIEKTDTSPQEAAIRELQEEVGCSVEEWISLGCYWRAPSFLTTRAHFYLARCSSGAVASRNRDRQEAATVQMMSIHGAKRRTPDLTSLTALSLAEDWLRKERPER